MPQENKNNLESKKQTLTPDSNESKESLHEKLGSNQADLSVFNKEFQEKREGNNKEFLKKLEELEKTDRTNSKALKKAIRDLRTANVTKEQDEYDNQQKNVLLSSVFLSQGDSIEGHLTYKIDFKNYQLSNRYVGLGDLLPVNIEKVAVYDEKGQLVSASAARGVNKDGRVGYFDTNTGSYIAVYSNFKVAVLATRTSRERGSSVVPDQVVERKRLSEHIQLMRTVDTLADGYFGIETAQVGLSQNPQNSDSRIVAPELKNTSQNPELKASINRLIKNRLAPYMSIIQNASTKYNVPANLIMAVIWQESGGRVDIASSTNAGGLMQLIPSTARQYGLTNISQCTKDPVTGLNKIDSNDDRANPEKNIDAGTRLLASLLSKYNGNVNYALAAYNWGSGNVDKFLRNEKEMPRETKMYIKNIPMFFNSLQLADGKVPQVASADVERTGVTPTGNESSDHDPNKNRLIQTAKNYIGVIRNEFRTPDVSGGSLACAKVASTILYDAGYLNAIYLGVDALKNALLEKGWTYSSTKPEPGDVVIWGSSGQITRKTDNGTIVMPGHKHIGIATGSDLAVNNNSAKGMPTESKIYTGRPVEAILKPPSANS